MTVGNVTNTSISSINQSASAQLTQNYSTFLQMLTTQLKNQDPTAPMDSTQFTQQLVMYSQVEQQINTNNYLSQLVSASGTDQANAALGYIGMQVDAPGSSFTYSGQPVDLGYALPSDASTATITITDQDGNAVWSQNANTASGNYNFTWNGTDQNGDAVSSGTYTITLSAKDSDGTTINGTTAVPGIVDGVQTNDGTVYLTVDGSEVPLSSVTNAVKPTASN